MHGWPRIVVFATLHDMEAAFEALTRRVQTCRACPRMEGRTRVLSRANGLVGARVMFVAEAPGRLGADRTGVPLSGDRTGRNFDALLSAEARGAFRIGDEPAEVRDRYGRHIHGQCLLLARRLVESGVQLVTVNWHDDGQNFWDTHGQNFAHLKDRLMPPTDQGLSALLDDLEARGLLDETLVVWVGEFGRNPRITRANAGREHWPRCYSAVVAGGGVRGGLVHGASDRWAAYPASDPVSPADLAATILLALGIDPSGEILDPVGRVPHDDVVECGHGRSPDPPADAGR